MSQVLEARRAEMTDLQKSEKDLKRVEDEIETVLYGTGFSFEYSEDSLRGRSEALSLELAGRGRVWRSGEISVNGAERTFQFPSNRVEHIPQMVDMVLFAFADQVFEGDDYAYPVSFVGSFRVKDDTPNALQLVPIFISDQEEYEAPLNTWTLYEKSPADQRDAYIRDTDVQIDEAASQLNEELARYRNVLQNEFMPAESFGLDINDQQQAREYEFIIDRIMFDGLSLVKIESYIESQSDRIAERFDPPVEEIFVEFRFDEKSNRPFQVDSSGNIENDGQFTRNGMAVDPSLHAGGEIEFQKGDVILIDQLTADGYQRGDEPVPPFSTQEPVTEVTRRFVRQLSDFPFLLQKMTRQSEIYDSELARVQQNNERSRLAIGDAESQASVRDDAIEKLIVDRDNFSRDLQTISSFLDSTRIRKTDVEMNVSGLEKKILSIQRKISGFARLLEQGANPPVPQLELLPNPGSGIPISDPIIDAPLTPPNNLAPAGDFNSN